MGLLTGLLLLYMREEESFWTLVMLLNGSHTYVNTSLENLPNEIPIVTPELTVSSEGKRNSSTKQACMSSIRGMYLPGLPLLKAYI